MKRVRLLEARKLFALNAAAGGEAGGETLHGFRIMVSSSREVFSLTDADAPAAGARAVVFGGLRCLSRLSARGWAMLGPAKTVREYAAEIEALVVAESYDAMHKAKDFDDPDDGAAGAAAADEVAEKLSAIFADDGSVSNLQLYLSSVRKVVSSYVDSASGERRSIDGESIPLSLFSNQAFDDMCGDDDAATQADLCCPITSRIMKDPVRCSDGRTYERSAIERWFRIHGTSPMTRHALAREPGDDTLLQCEVDMETSPPDQL